MSRSSWLPSLSRSGPVTLLLLSVLLVAAGAAAAVAWSRTRSADREVLARVNGEPVTRTQVQRMLADPIATQDLQREYGAQNVDTNALERLAVRQLIIRRLVLHEAAQRRVTVTEQEVDQRITEVRRRFADLQKFDAWLKGRGLDQTSFRKAIHTDMVMARVRAGLVAGVRITEEQVQEYYEAHKHELNTDEEVRLRIIAVEGPAAADQILTALRSGEEFDRLARTRSRGFRAEQGGDIGWMSPGRLPPPVRQAVMALKPGETGGPVQAGAQFLVVRLAERRPPHAMTLAEARPAIERGLLAAKQREALRAWLSEQEKKSRIELSQPWRPPVTRTVVLPTDKWAVPRIDSPGP
jgi:peptidyl-prolyl cis-trans isomerase SurA